jgi:hypothetical protein
MKRFMSCDGLAKSLLTKPLPDFMKRGFAVTKKAIPVQSSFFETVESFSYDLRTCRLAGP